MSDRTDADAATREQIIHSIELIASLNAEVERLRAALKRIASQDCDPFAANPAMWPSTIAKDALEQSQAGGNS